jgi:hypothetical protein
MRALRRGSKRLSTHEVLPCALARFLVEVALWSVGCLHYSGEAMAGAGARIPNWRQAARFLHLPGDRCRDGVKLASPLGSEEPQLLRAITASALIGNPNSLRRQQASDNRQNHHRPVPVAG